MSIIDGVLHRIRVLLRGERYARDVGREMAFHVELETLANRGAADVDVELTARRNFGNTTYYREEVRRMTPLSWIDRILQDASYATRGFRRAPGFTAAVVLTLALGIGVNGAMFSLLDRVFVQPPAGVARPAELRRLYMEYHEPDNPSGRGFVPSYEYPMYRAMTRALGPSFPIAGYMTPDSVTLADGRYRTPTRFSYVTGGYFEILNVRPAWGRFFAVDEAGQVETPTPVAVISNQLWRRAFGSDPSTVGRQVVVGRRHVTIVGIAPAGFSGLDLDAAELWMPVNMVETDPFGMPGPWYESFNNGMRLVVRATDAVTEQRLTAIGTAAYRTVHIKGLFHDSTAIVRTGPIVAAMGPGARNRQLTVATRLAGVSVIVLIIAFANITNLLLLRAARRGREIGVRRALGVSRRRLYEQFAVESVLLAALGGAVAVLFAWWAASALRRLVLPSVHWASSAIDARTILVIGGLGVAIGLLASIAPTVRALQLDLSDSLRAGTREGGRRHSRLRSGLVVVQAALAIVLIVGAGLFLRSLEKVTSIDVGYDVESLLAVQPTFADGGRHDAEVKSMFPRVAERLRGIEGVESVGYTTMTPMDGASYVSVMLPDRDSIPALPGVNGPSFMRVSVDYFRTVGLRSVAGRTFTASDRSGAPTVAVVSERMARMFWPGQSPMGKCLLIGKRTAPCATVVGVVADAHRYQMVEPPVFQYYLAIDQSADAARNLVIRVPPRRMALVAREAEQALRQLIPGVDGATSQRISDLVEPELRPWRFGATLLTAFSALALLVAGVGIYSVVAYGVSQRTHEIGVRLALGARMSDILRLVLSGGFRVVAIGIALGLLAALGLGRLVASLLYGVTPHDPTVFLSASAVLGAIALFACLVPAWRAGRVDPTTALRSD